MEALIGLGDMGRLGTNEKKEIDCLLVHKNSRRIGIEIKGGHQKKLSFSRVNKKVKYRYTVHT